jgi:molecular chaperone DnaK
MTTSQAVGQRVYEQAQQQAAAGNEGGADSAEPADDDVVEAEIVDEGEEA